MHFVILFSLKVPHLNLNFYNTIFQGRAMHVNTILQIHIICLGTAMGKFCTDHFFVLNCVLIESNGSHALGSLEQLASRQTNTREPTRLNQKTKWVEQTLPIAVLMFHASTLNTAKY